MTDATNLLAFLIETLLPPVNCTVDCNCFKSSSACKVVHLYEILTAHHLPNCSSSHCIHNVHLIVDSTQFDTLTDNVASSDRNHNVEL